MFEADITHRNGNEIDFNAFKAQRIQFCYMKCGQGKFKDSLFDLNGTSLGSVNSIYRGAYFFLSSRRGGAEQGELFAKLMGPLRPTDLPPVIDLEWDVAPGNRDQWTHLTPHEIIDEVLACLDAVHTTTRREPMIYSAGSWLNERVREPAEIARLSNYPLWVADYSRSSLGLEAPQVPSGFTHKLWQFTDRSELSDGYEQTLDASIYRG